MASTNVPPFPFPPPPPPAPEPRARVTKKLPTFRIGFPKQLDGLRGYAVLSENGTKAVHYTRVADIIKVHEANVSSMNPFFLENGFMEKSGPGYMPNAAVIEYNRQYAWTPDTAAQKLAPIIANTWFAQALVNRLQFRAMSEDEGIDALASECSANPEAKPQLRMLLDYLEAAGLIVRAGGQLSAVAKIPPPPPPPVLEPPLSQPAGSLPITEAVDPPRATSTVSNAARGGSGGINLDVSINVNLADMKDWPPDRISAFFAGIAQVLTAKNG